ncbi:MAG: biotin-dependent carboxyltransferase family protein [Thiobacillus sp.]|nr:biotin-dependent carboxyltransferase family protein [Thiobacillus sp.]
MIEVLHAGLCDLVVDQGRPGLGALGVPVGGAADALALVAANRLVGNEDTAAGLECTLRGPRLRFPAGGMVALTGARFTATRSSGGPVSWNETLMLGENEVLTLGEAPAGCRCWLALQGGVTVPQLMGSRSTFLPAGWGGHQGRPLQAGDRLASGMLLSDVHMMRAYPPTPCEGPLRVVPGPQVHLLDNDGLAALFAGEFRVAAASDRRGLRLAGPMVSHIPVDLPSQGVMPGAIQVPPDGQPIILGWDGPVTGGYPVVAGVITADWPRLAQLRPGDTVRFVTIEQERARQLAQATWRIEALA